MPPRRKQSTTNSNTGKTGVAKGSKRLKSVPVPVADSILAAVTAAIGQFELRTVRSEHPNRGLPVLPLLQMIATYAEPFVTTRIEIDAEFRDSDGFELSLLGNNCGVGACTGIVAGAESGFYKVQLTQGNTA